MADSFRHIPRFLGCALCLCALCLSLSSFVGVRSAFALDAISAANYDVQLYDGKGFVFSTGQWVNVGSTVANNPDAQKIVLNRQAATTKFHVIKVTYYAKGILSTEQTQRQIVQYYVLQTSGTTTVQNQLYEDDGLWWETGYKCLQMSFGIDTSTPRKYYPKWQEVTGGFYLTYFDIDTYTGVKKPKVEVLYTEYPGYWANWPISAYAELYILKDADNGEYSLLQTIIALIRAKIEEVNNDIEVDTTGIESTISGQTSDLQSSISSQTSSINSSLSSGFSGVNSAISSLGTSLGSAVSTAQSAITGAISTAQSAITGGLSSLGQTLSGIASALPVFGKGQYGNGSGVSISTQTKNNFNTLLQTKAPICYFVMVNDEIGRLSSTYSSASLASNSNLYIDLPIPYAGNVRFDLKDSFLGQAVGNVYLYNGIRFALTLFLVVMIVYGGSRLALSIAFGGSDD